jgi:hypothetical protein
VPFESLHNFYETLVLKAIKDYSLFADELRDNDFLEDVACVALNHLPPKYVRYDVDLMFYMTSSEKEQVESAVNNAVKNAIEFVRKHRRNNDDTTDQDEKIGSTG